MLAQGKERDLKTGKERRASGERGQKDKEDSEQPAGHLVFDWNTALPIASLRPEYDFS